MIQSRGGASCIGYNTNIFVFGGTFYYNPYYPDIYSEKYNIETQRWILSKSSMPWDSSHKISLILMDNNEGIYDNPFIYAIAGMSGYVLTNKQFIYDINNDLIHKLNTNSPGYVNGAYFYYKPWNGFINIFGHTSNIFDDDNDYIDIGCIIINGIITTNDPFGRCQNIDISTTTIIPTNNPTDTPDTIDTTIIPTIMATENININTTMIYEMRFDDILDIQTVLIIIFALVSGVLYCGLILLLSYIARIKVENSRTVAVSTPLKETIQNRNTPNFNPTVSLAYLIKSNESNTIAKPSTPYPTRIDGNISTKKDESLCDSNQSTEALYETGSTVATKESFKNVYIGSSNDEEIKLSNDDIKVDISKVDSLGGFNSLNAYANIIGGPLPDSPRNDFSTTSIRRQLKNEGIIYNHENSSKYKGNNELIFHSEYNNNNGIIREDITEQKNDN